jgi:hypothetical protein
MKLKATILTLILAATFLVVAAKKKDPSIQSQSDQPKLVIASLEYSFGTVKAGSPLKYTFKVKNEGKAALEIKSVSPSCGCTTSNFDKMIAQGETGGISLAIEKTENYRGEIIKTAEVTTNDPNQSKFTLVLKANFTEK